MVINIKEKIYIFFLLKCNDLMWPMMNMQKRNWLHYVICLCLCFSSIVVAEPNPSIFIFIFLVNVIFIHHPKTLLSTDSATRMQYHIDCFWIVGAYCYSEILPSIRLKKTLKYSAWITNAITGCLQQAHL